MANDEINKYFTTYKLCYFNYTIIQKDKFSNSNNF